VRGRETSLCDVSSLDLVLLDVLLVGRIGAVEGGGDNWSGNSSVGDLLGHSSFVDDHGVSVEGGEEESDERNEVGSVSTHLVGNGTLHWWECSSSSNTHAEKSGSSLGELAEVTSGEGEDGRVDGGFEEENDEEGSETDSSGVGEGGGEGEDGAHGSPDGEDDSGSEDAKERNGCETSDPRKSKEESQSHCEWDEVLWRTYMKVICM